MAGEVLDSPPAGPQLRSKIGSTAPVSRISTTSSHSRPPSTSRSRRCERPGSRAGESRLHAVASASPAGPRCVPSGSRGCEACWVPEAGEPARGRLVDAELLPNAHEKPVGERHGGQQLVLREGGRPATVAGHRVHEHSSRRGGRAAGRGARSETRPSEEVQMDIRCSVNEPSPSTTPSRNASTRVRDQPSTSGGTRLARAPSPGPRLPNTSDKSAEQAVMAHREREVGTPCRPRIAPALLDDRGVCIRKRHVISASGALGDIESEQPGEIGIDRQGGGQAVRGLAGGSRSAGPRRSSSPGTSEAIDSGSRERSW